MDPRPLPLGKLAAAGDEAIRATPALLITVHDDACSEYVDLKSTKEMRERVVGMPDATSRDWLKDDDEGKP